MSKYNLTKLGSIQFEALVQSLLEPIYRKDNGLIQFGEGKDGAREAIFKYRTDETAIEWKNCIVQAKFHDGELRGWTTARKAILEDIEKELDKIVHKYKYDCQKYILVTNVPFTGVAMTGTKDLMAQRIDKWKHHIPEIEVWDASDLSCMLDANSSVRTAFLDTILPGDVLKSIIEFKNEKIGRRESVFRANLLGILDAQRGAKAEEAGDEDGSLPIEQIFIDLTLCLTDCSDNNLYNDLSEFTNIDLPETNELLYSPTSIDCVRSSFALLVATYQYVLIVGGPGVGKSTITQFLALYHAARLTNSPIVNLLVKRLMLPTGIDSSYLDSICEVRYPIRVELRRYSIWISTKIKENSPIPLAQYIVDCINVESSGNIDMDDLFHLTSNNPILLMLDGLDEVPNASARSAIFDELSAFLRRCEGEKANVQVILSTRPQGYRSEFIRFEPITWTVNELSREDFNKYKDDWFFHRINNSEERSDAMDRIDEGLKSSSVGEMAKTLLQATVMLTIAKRKQAIPHARHKLFQKYVEVIFNREKIKEPTVRDHEVELLKLHEKVGYKLIERAQYQDKSTTISDTEFKSYVQSVLIEYGSPGMTIESISGSVDAIIDLSKNRLCLLAGKGEEQENVDFVVQSFREFFAASFMYTHERKSSDLIFHSLIERRNIWSNVFQFYAAFEDNQKHRNWIAEADIANEDISDPKILTKRVRIRQELLRVLPEFGGLVNRTAWQALVNIFGRKTRWTWTTETDVNNKLNVFGSGDHSGYLKSEFYPFDECDTLRRNFEIRTMIEHCSKECAENNVYLVEAELRKNRYVDTILGLVLDNEIKVNIPEECEIPYVEATGKYRFITRDIDTEALIVNQKESCVLTYWASKPKDKIFLRQRSNIFEYYSELDAIFLRNFDSVGGVDGFRCVVANIFLIDRAKITNQLVEKTKNIGGPMAEYLVALFNALLNPLDDALYQIALEIERCVGSVLSENLNVTSQLGPTRSQYKNAKDYELARSQSIDIDELHALVKPLLDKPIFGMAFVIKTSFWTFLKDKLNEEDYKYLDLKVKKWFDKRGFGYAQHVRLDFTNINSNVAVPKEDAANLVYYVTKLMSSNSMLMEGVSSERISFLVFSRVRAISFVPDEFHHSEIEKLYVDSLTIDSYSLYIDFLIAVFSKINNFTTERIIKLWEKHYSVINSGDVLSHIIADEDIIERRINDATRINTCGSISYAIALSKRRRRIPPEYAQIFLDSYCSDKPNSKRMISDYLNLGLKGDLVDMGFLLDPEKMYLYEDSVIAHRLVVALRSCVVDGSIDLLQPKIELLRNLVKERNKYSINIQSDLLDTLLIAEETSMTPLNEKRLGGVSIVSDILRIKEFSS